MGKAARRTSHASPTPQGCSCLLYTSNIQLVLDEPRAFTGFKARLVNFTNVRNYLALVGPECKELDGIVGYYGEQLVLLAQSLGLNSCWAGGTYKVVNRAYNVDLGQKLAAVIALGYGATQGVPHRSKAPQELSLIHISHDF